MSVEDHAVVDAIGVERHSGKVVLTISDHLDWSSEQEHLHALQEKIDTYLRFIESGELEQAYPDARGRAPVIDLVAQHQPSALAQEFLCRARGALSIAGVELRSRPLDEDEC